MDPIEKYNQTKRAIEKAKAKCERAAGAIGQLVQQLKEFECDDVEEAEKKLKKWERELEEENKTKRILIENFNEQWSEKMEEFK